jgi:hypothetical protein
MEFIHQDGDSTSEVKDMCVCSTLYCTRPNLPSPTGEYHNEGNRYADSSSPLAFHNLIARP